MIDTSPINKDVELFKRLFEPVWYRCWPYTKVVYFEQPGELLRIGIDYAERGRFALMDYTVDMRVLRPVLQNCQQADYIRFIVRDLSDKIVCHALDSGRKETEVQTHD